MAGAAGSGRLLRASIPDKGCGHTNSTPVDLAVIEGSPQASVSRAFQLLGGVGTFIKPNTTVLLKPNASFPNPEKWGSTTSPGVIKAVAEVALKAGARRVIIADNTMRDGDLCFEKTGLTTAFEGMSRVSLIPLQRESYYADVPVDGKALKSVQIAKLIQRADILINLPCAKSHNATDVSFALKNLMGLIWDRSYFHSGTDLHMAIAELATVIRPQLTILDATRALVTGGPTGPGKVQELHTIVAGTDSLAVDSYGVNLTQWNNRSSSVASIKHLAYAADLGIGRSDLKSLNIHKETV